MFYVDTIRNMHIYFLLTVVWISFRSILFRLRRYQNLESIRLRRLLGFLAFRTGLVGGTMLFCCLAKT